VTPTDATDDGEHSRNDHDNNNNNTGSMIAGMSTRGSAWRAMMVVVAGVGASGMPPP
jgi:hypothetical protein